MYKSSNFIFLKLTLLLLLCFSGHLSLLAQAPQSINYQGVARDNLGNALSNQSIALRFTLHSNNTSGPIEYQESHLVTSSSLGLFDLLIGNGTVLQGNFSLVDWGSSNFFIEIEMDETGGSNYSNLGSSQLVSVPYALHAQTASNVDDDDADPINELQSLSKTGNTVSLSQSGGSFTDDVNDPDADPSNELQTISKSGSTVSLSNGGGSFTDETDDNDWNFSGNDLYSANSGDVGIGVSNPGRKLSVLNTIEVVNSSGSRLVDLHGITGNTAGRLDAFGANGNVNASLSHLSGQSDLGFLGIFNGTGAQRFGASQGSGANNSGLFWTYGNNSNLNCYGTYLSGNPDNGFFAVYDGSGNSQAGAYVNSSGQGVIWGDVKNFRMPHPKQPGKEIWYASLEGPEAAAYCRGTGNLTNGRTVINFSEHFSLLVNPNSLTIILTPLDGSSKGLAVVEKIELGFEVVELMGGNGNYKFDWEAKAVRKGYENYQVVRDASEMQAGGLDEKGFAPRSSK